MRTFLRLSTVILCFLNVLSAHGQEAVNPSDVFAERIYKVLDFPNALTPADHKQLMAAGIELLGYKGGNSYLVSLPADKVILQRLPVRIQPKVESFTLTQKMAAIDLQSVPDHAKTSGGVGFTVMYARDLDQETVVRDLTVQGFKVVDRDGKTPVLEVVAALGRAEDLAARPYILAVEYVGLPGEPEDRRGRNLHRVNKLAPTNGLGLDYSGRGEAVLVRDDGALFEHIDFQGRIFQDEVGPSDGDHGDGVGGIMAGAGNLDPDFTGMAYGADMHVVDYRGNFLGPTMRVVEENNIRVTNSSYSDGCNAGYTMRTRTVDLQVFDDSKLMHVFSAGNNGTSNCGYGAGERWGNVTGGHKIGKNVIAVANLDPFGNLVSSSSRGPSADGRLKPDISANGFQHVSTAEEHDYMVFGGTSAAAPVVTGVMAIMHEAYQDTYGEVADAALLKTLMLNTADDLGNVGPDFLHGWGKVNAYKAVSAVQSERFATVELVQDEVVEVDIEVPANTHSVKVMTYWPDPEAVDPSQILINDVNTYIFGDSVLHQPYVLDYTPDPDRLRAPATRGVDSINNVEQIEILNPEEGTYKLNIAGLRVPMGSVKCYVSWEFISNEIEIIYPSGGEHVTAGETSFIAWDAGGVEERFSVELVEGDGTTQVLGTRSGTTRLMAWNPGDDYNDDVKIRITRGSQVEESDSTFIIADRAEDLTLLEDGDTIVWDSISGAISYIIYSLEEKYMEVADTSLVPTYTMSADSPIRSKWISVAPVFVDGRVGERTTAINTRKPLVPSYINSDNDEPCVDQPTTFRSDNDPSGIEIEWAFGSRATPSEAFGPGPHEVVYSRDGRASGRLFLRDAFGQESILFRMDVQEIPVIDDIDVEDLGEDTYRFIAETEGVTDYVWSFGDGTTSTEESPTHTFTEVGTYTVELVASSSCGEAKETIEVEVIITSVQNSQPKLDDMHLQPNPSSGAFEVVLPSSGESVLVQIYTLDGNLLRTYRGMDKVGIEIEIAGTYILKATSADKQVHRRVQVIR